MSLGERIKRLRQERGWSQAQLAQQLGVHQKQVSGYERSVHLPSVEVLARLAELLNVSMDYLAIENRSDNPNVAQIADRDLLNKMREVDRLPEADKEAIKAVLDSFILKERFQQLARLNDSTLKAV